MTAKEGEGLTGLAAPLIYVREELGKRIKEPNYTAAMKREQENKIQQKKKRGKKTSILREEDKISRDVTALSNATSVSFDMQNCPCTRPIS